MAFVDINQERIVGCKPNTATWWHEKGHIEFSKLDKGISYPYKMSYCFGVAILFLAVFSLTSNYYIAIFANIFVIFALYYYFYEEVWCWFYAWKQIRSKDA